MLNDPPGAPPARTDHPAPRPRWLTRLLLPAVLLLAAVLLLGYSARDVLRPALAVDVSPVVLRAVEGTAQPAGSVVAQAPGWVEPWPTATLVGALREGVVSAVHVLEGDRVEAGQAVATLVDADAQLALRRAEAMLRSAQSAVELAQAALGDDATPGWALTELQAELDRFPADVAQHEAELAQLQTELDSRRLAVERGLVAPVQARTLEAKLRSAESRLQAMKKQEHVLTARLAARRAELRGQLEQARAQLAVAQAAHDEASLALQRCEVTSPVAGVVMTRLVEPGGRVSTDGPDTAGVVRLYDPQNLQVRVDVPLAQAAQVGVGTEALIVVDALPDETFHGKVERVAQEADISRNTLAFRVRIDSPSPQFKPQMLARVRLVAPAGPAKQSNASAGASGTRRTFAPVSVVGQSPGTTVDIWLADQEHRAQKRSVTVGTARHTQWIEVTQGLNPGDRVILNPPAGITPGARLRVREVDPSSEHRGNEGGAA